MGRMITVSSSEGRVAEWHDTITADGRRLTGVPRNADIALARYNEHWIGEYKSDGDKFNEIFQPAVDEFNARQNRPAKRMGPTSTKPERQKTYYEGIKDGTWCTGHDDTQEQAVYEAVLQLGNKDTLGTTDADFDIDTWYKLKISGQEDEASAYAVAHLNTSVDAERAKRIIHRAVNRIAAMDPDHLIVIRADWHGDEPCGTPNCHIAWVFKADGYKTGMRERTASVRALQQMGFTKCKELGYGIEQLHARFKDIIAEEMVADAVEYHYEAEAFERAPDSGEHRQRSEVDVFREMAAERKDLDKRKKETDEVLYAAKKTLQSAEKAELEAESKAAWLIKEAETQAKKTVEEKAPALIQEAIRNRVKAVDGLLEIMKQDAETEAEKIVSDAKTEAKLQAQVEAGKVIEEAKATAREEARKITEAADAVAERKSVDAQVKADKMQADAQAVADKIEEDAKTAAAQKAQDAEIEYRRRVKTADEEAEKIKVEKQAVLEQEKRKFDEDRQAYLQRLTEQAQRVRERSGLEEDPLPADADEQAVQDRMLADFQRWEDAIEAQKQSFEETYKEKETMLVSQTEAVKKAYEMAKKGYEEETTAVREEKPGSATGIVTDFMTMLQEIHPNEIVKKAAETVKNVVRKSAGKLDEYFAKWKEKRVAQRRRRIDDIESDLQESLRNGREYE